MTSPHLTDAQAQDLADGVLPRPQSEPLERHAADCARCRAEVESYRLLAGALEDLEVPPLAAGFTEGVLARIDAQERSAARERRLAAGIFAAVVLATAGAFALAGPSAWAQGISSIIDALTWMVSVAHAGATFVPAVAGALRVQILVASPLLALPFLLALFRLMPRPEAETA